jgi:hypothetical protein
MSAAAGGRLSVLPGDGRQQHENNYQLFGESLPRPWSLAVSKTFELQISLIDRVHKIYNDTIWQDRSDQEGFKGMGFVIKKIVVHSEPTRVRGGEAHYNMVREKWDVRNLLEVSGRSIFVEPKKQTVLLFLTLLTSGWIEGFLA